MMTSSLGKLGIFSVSTLRFDCREREIDQQGAKRWEPGELAGVQHGVRLQKRLGPHLQKGQNPGKADFISF